MVKMSEIHYAIHPGNVVGSDTGDVRHIGIKELADLYGLKPDEYMVWDEVLNINMINPLTGDRLIHLYPKEDGSYFKVPRKADDQLQLWAKGISLHMLSGGSGGVCCPDFSCCIEYAEPTSISVRERFVKARAEKDSIAIAGFLSMFMSSALLAEYPDGGVTITGGANVKVN